MARTRSTRKPAARTTAKKTSARKPAAGRASKAAKTSASSRGSKAKAKAKAPAKASSSSQGADAEFRAEVQELVEKLITSRRPWALRKARQDFERSYVNHIIQRSDMDRQRAATRLDIGFSTLKEKIRAPGKR